MSTSWQSGVDVSREGALSLISGVLAAGSRRPKALPVDETGDGAGRGGCGRIDTHAHYIPASYRAALADAGVATVDGGIPLPPWSAGDHVAMMDRHRIAISVLSLSSPGVQILEAGQAARLARAVNEEGAAIGAAHPGRFGLFISLPLPDVAASLEEIRYGFDTLNADGVVMMTNIQGRYLGDPAFLPVFEALGRRGAVVYLHPTSPCGLGLASLGMPGPVIEFPFDTVRAAVSLVYSGRLKHCPNLKLLLSHAGGALPILVSRIAAMSALPLIKPRPEGGGEEVRAQFARIYYDLALSANPVAFNALREITTLDHITFGTDYPFSGNLGLDLNIESFDALSAGLSREDKGRIEAANALALLPRLRRFLTG
jgi:predicted TIM-barrel fold metal-dependent hydrolase